MALLVELGIIYWMCTGGIRVDGTEATGGQTGGPTVH